MILWRERKEELSKDNTLGSGLSGAIYVLKNCKLNRPGVKIKASIL